MNTFSEYTFDNKVQLLLQQKYNIENISSPSNATANNIVNNNNNNNDQLVTNMLLNNLSKPKRRQVKNACVNCQKACKKCDEGRPCQRCIKYNLTETCQDSVRKERKKGVKRGPYKRGHLDQPLGKRVNTKVMKKQDTNASVSTAAEDNGSIYPHKSSATQMSVLPNNKCDNTNEHVTQPLPSAICSSQNNLPKFTTSSSYHKNQFNHPGSIVYNNNVMGEYHHDRDNNNVNMIPSPMSNHIDTMAINGQSPQHCPPVSQEHNLVNLYSFYNSHIRHEQNSLNMYGTPVGSPIISSDHNPIALDSDFVVDLPWQPPNTEKFYTDFYCQ